MAEAWLRRVREFGPAGEVAAPEESQASAVQPELHVALLRRRHAKVFLRALQRFFQAGVGQQPQVTR